jgi:hypothetical protein
MIGKRVSWTLRGHEKLTGRVVALVPAGVHAHDVARTIEGNYCLDRVRDRRPVSYPRWLCESTRDVRCGVSINSEPKRSLWCPSEVEVIA